MPRLYTFENVPASVLNAAIEEWVHHSRNRQLCRMYFLDGMTADEIADREHLSVNQIYEVTRKYGKILSAHMDTQ